MSIPLVAFEPFVNYIGVPFFKPAQLAGIKGYCIPLSFTWLAYGVSLAQPNIGVLVDTSFIAAPRPLDQIRSVYIDNIGNQVPVIVTFPDTGFAVACQANASGWYPVFTNSTRLVVGVMGFNNANNTGSTNVLLSNIPISPYTDPAQQNVNALELSSPVIGGGSSLATLFNIAPGSSYNNGNLSITGGGGTGASASGTLDVYGRFVGTTLIGGGNGYVGNPVVAPTGGQTPPNAFVQGATYNPGLSGANLFTYGGTIWYWNGSHAIQTGAAAWSAGHGFYNPGDEVNYQNYIWYCTQSVNNGIAPPNDGGVHWTLLGYFNPSVAGGWVNSGIAPSQTATFGTTLTAPSTVIFSSGFSLPALGDQAQSYVNAVTGAGVFVNNLFGTPFASGFIYLTHFNVRILAVANQNSWQLENDSGYVPFPFESSNNTTVNDILTLNKANIKLDATKTWRLNCTAFASNFTVSHAFAWTYSQQ